MKLEKDIQKVIEKHLDVFFGLDFVSTEFTIGKFRCDTFAFDKESQSFVVIEYKKQTDKGLFDQGLGYFELMSSRQADFLTEYNEKTSNHLLKKDISWEQSKIIFISPSFNESQIQASNFDVNIELWEIHFYDDILELSKKHGDNKTQMPIKGKQAKIIEKFKTYTEKNHFQARNTQKTRPLYEKYRNQIMNLPDIQMNIRKHYIAFKTKNNFVSFTLLKSKLVINLIFDEKKSKDPKKIVKSVKNIGHWGAGNHVIYVNDERNFDYIINLIKQAYEITKK